MSIFRNLTMAALFLAAPLFAFGAQLTPDPTHGIGAVDGTKVLKLSRTTPGATLRNSTSVSTDDFLEVWQDGSFRGALYGGEVTGTVCVINVTIEAYFPDAADEWKDIVLTQMASAAGFGLVLIYPANALGADTATINETVEAALPMRFRVSFDYISGTCDTVKAWLHGLP